MIKLNEKTEKCLQEKSFFDAYNKGSNAEVILKFYNPTGSEKWFVTGADKLPDGDWMFYGLAYIQHWEISTFLLSELIGYESNYNVKIEVDESYINKQTLKVAYDEICFSKKTTNNSIGKL